MTLEYNMCIHNGVLTIQSLVAFHLPVFDGFYPLSPPLHPAGNHHAVVCIYEGFLFCFFLSWELFDSWLKRLTCYLSVDFLFLPNSVLAGSMFLGIGPFLPGHPLCWQRVGHSHPPRPCVSLWCRLQCPLFSFVILFIWVFSLFSS